jgi:hypothetical protein
MHEPVAKNGQKNRGVALQEGNKVQVRMTGKRRPPAPDLRWLNRLMSMAVQFEMCGATQPKQDNHRSRRHDIT